MTPLSGFLPDVDAATPGAIIDCTNVTPFARGMQGAPTAVTVDGVPALAAACRNAAVATKLDGTRRFFGGTAAKLYELSAGSWADVSRAGNYTLGADDRWDFAQFGNATLACNKSTKIQRSNGSGAFSDIASAPKAMAIESASGFVVAFNTDDGTNNDYDRWWCCGINDETTWAVSLTTQANSGRLVSSPGAITAAKSFGDQIVAYKDRSLYLGRYVGSPVVWQWDLILGDVGCVGVDAVTDIGGAGHVFVGRSDIMVFDGTRPQSIAEGAVRQWFYNNVSQAYLYRTTVLHDKQNNVVWIFYPDQSSGGELNQALVFHLGTKRWGRCTQTIEGALNYVSAGATVDTLTGTIDTLPNVSFDSQYWLAGGRQLTVITSAHQLSTMTGVSVSSSMTLFDVGDDQIVSRLSRLRVGYQANPTTATVVGVVKMSRGEGGKTGGTGTYSAGKFDIRQSGRFHRLTVSQTGNWSAAVVDFDFANAGNR